RGEEMNASTILKALQTLRPAIATVLVLSVVTASLQLVTHAPSAILGEPPAFTILPDGEDVARLSPVTVTFARSPEERGLDQLFVQFSRAVAPLTTLSAQRTEPVVQFEPALHGTGEWLNTSIYRFLPSDLTPATTYHLKIAKGLTSAADGVLQQDFVASFTTIMPAVDLVQPDTNWIYCGPWQQVDVTFNQPMDASAASGFSIVNAETGIAPPGGLSWNDK